MANTKIVTSLNVDSYSLSPGSDFKDYFSIQKISLKEITTDQRELIVYFKRHGLKMLSTRGSNPCTSSDTSGCYLYVCNVKYTGSPVDACSALDCYDPSDDGHLISHNTFETKVNEILKKIDDLSSKMDGLTINNLNNNDNDDDNNAGNNNNNAGNECTPTYAYKKIGGKKFCNSENKSNWVQYVDNQCHSFCKQVGESKGIKTVASATTNCASTNSCIDCRTCNCGSTIVVKACP